MTAEFEQFLNTLTPRQQQVAEMVIWQRESWRSFGRKLGITGGRVTQIAWVVMRKWRRWDECRRAQDATIELAGEMALRRKLLAALTRDAATKQ